MFQYAADVTLRTGRNSYRLFVPRVRTTIERQRVTSQALCHHFRGAKEYGFLLENECFAVAGLLKSL